MFSKLRKKRQVGDRRIVREGIFVKFWFLKNRADNRVLERRRTYTRRKKQIDNLCDAGKKSRKTVFEKPGRYRIKFAMFVERIQTELRYFFPSWGMKNKE